MIQIHSEDEIESFRYGGGLFGVNCGHHPMVFIPGVSTIKGEPAEDAEENARDYAESQQQRALERKLREEKRDLEILKAQGAPDEEIKAQRAKVRQASSEIDAFCDETGRHRQRRNEYTPVNASWDGAKVPPYGVPVENVTYEYHAKAKPGVGEVTKEKGYKSENSRHETKVANDLVRQIGGNITQIKRSEGEPDYKWRGTFWEVKETSSANSVDKQTEHALNQTVKYGGNIIIDYDGKEEINYKSIILNRVRRSAKHSFDIFVLRNGEIKGIYRYKK